jgi:hypothetical protein
MNSKYERKWKEGATNLSNINAGIAGQTAETLKILGQYSRFPGRDLNPELPEYEAECQTFDLDIRSEQD